MHSNTGEVHKALRDVMQDNAWHPFSEFLSAVRTLITPERASRIWLHEEKYRIRRLKNYDPEADISEELSKTPHEARVAFGVRRHTSNVLSRMVAKAIAERNKVDGVNHYRLVPNEIT